GRFLSQKLCFSYKSLRKNIKHSLEKIVLPKFNLGKRRNDNSFPSATWEGRTKIIFIPKCK
ncbi:MAG TPA: hypothetical protein PKY56_00935, partial [Candidatus Kapabacteria bacterium]|nr:hypothetical protein [Candidatus Kapabacteria bacterium]